MLAVTTALQPCWVYNNLLANKMLPEYEDSNVEQHGSTVGLFTCIEEGCVKSFQRFSSLQNHLDLGKHNYVLERETFLDKVMVQYVEKLEQGASSLESPLFECASKALSVVTPILQGWTLKCAATTRRRLTKEQKNKFVPYR